jgi:hypothetical protein
VSGDFFAAMEIPLLAGRVFDSQDVASAPARAVVGEGFAHVAFPELPLEQVVGQTISAAGLRREIIGVAGDVALDPQGSPAFVIYHAHRQIADNRNWALTHVVSTSVPPEVIVPAIREALREMDPELVVYNAVPMREIIGRGVGRERFSLILMATFASLAITLAAVGLYGTLAHMMRNRTRELGVRMALGASSADVHRLVIGQAARVLLPGIALGLLGALLLTDSLSFLIFEISPRDPGVFALATATLVLVAIVAIWLPAVRAARVDPRGAMTDS